MTASVHLWPARTPEVGARPASCVRLAPASQADTHRLGSSRLVRPTSVPLDLAFLAAFSDRPYAGPHESEDAALEPYSPDGGGSVKRRLLAEVRRPWLFTACMAVMAVNSVAIAVEYRPEDLVGLWLVRGCALVSVLALVVCVAEACFGEPRTEVGGEGAEQDGG